MHLNLFPRFVRGLRIAGWLAVGSAVGFPTQARAAGPTIVSVVPASGATGVSASASVVFTFSSAMNTTLTMATFQDTNGAMLTTTPLWSADMKTLTCTPTPPFPSPDFIIWFVSGEDISGNALQGIPAGTFTVGGGSSGGGGCTPVGHTNTTFILEESWLYNQTSAGPPALESADPYFITAEISLVSNLTASAASLTLPNFAVSNLADLLGDGQTFLASDLDTNLAELNASWPSGNYTFNTTGASLPAVTVSFNFAQPTTPQIANFAATQAVDSTKAFTLSWNPFSNRTDTNEIFINIGYDPCAGTGFATNLPGTATSTTIPAGALLPGSNYVNSTLGFINTSGTVNANPKYTAGAVRSSVTSFTLTTIGGGGGSASLSFANPVWSSGSLSFGITTAPDKFLTVQYSPTLGAGSWTTLLTTNSGSGTVTVTVKPSKTAPVGFYRAHE
ncbi:MAG: Ig-like domain-containing protein [Limisphaerales bacterium]